MSKRQVNYRRRSEPATRRSKTKLCRPRNERAKRKKRRQVAKQSRRRNR